MNPSRSEAPKVMGPTGQTDFSLFGLPEQFSVDESALDAAWKRLQSVAHPDRFSASSDFQRRVALQWSTRINEAHQVLKDPVQRATYLLSLYGRSIEAESNTSMPVDFLSEQMALREALDAARERPEPHRGEALAELRAHCDRALKKGFGRLGELLDAHPDDDALDRAVEEVRALMFIDRFRDEI